jgi:hypothetical protein
MVLHGEFILKHIGATISSSQCSEQILQSEYWRLMGELNNEIGARDNLGLDVVVISASHPLHNIGWDGDRLMGCNCPHHHSYNSK